MAASTTMRDRRDTRPLCNLRPVPTLRRVAGLLSTFSLAVAGLVACGGDTTSPSSGLDLTTAYWALHLNQHAVTLALSAPQDTIYLTATPVNINGQPLSGLGPVQYTAADSTVIVDATGLVTAKFVTGNNTTVTATLTDTVHHVTLQDTCFIQVTATGPAAPLSAFTLQSSEGDTIPMKGGSTLNTSGTDAVGNPVPYFAYFTSGDSSIVTINKLTGVLASQRTGQVMLYAETWAYGVAKRDSFALTVGYRSSGSVTVLPVTPTGSTHAVLTFWPQIIKISSGGSVTWKNNSFTDSIDVVFDDPANIDSADVNAFTTTYDLKFGTGTGNIAPWVNDLTGSNQYSALICTRTGGTPPNCDNDFVEVYSKLRARRFPVTGTYRYHSTKWSTSGTIIVL